MEYHLPGLILYRVVETVKEKVVFEVRREGRVVSYAYGSIQKHGPVVEGKHYGSQDEAKAAALAAAEPAEEDVPDADKKPKPGARGRKP